MTNKTQHACALEINATGILIKGMSGSGKTSLMLGLIERAAQYNITAALIADDQVILKTNGDTLEASAPETIKGLVELRGYGIMKCANKATTQIALVVELVEDEKIQRMPEASFGRVEGINLPLLKVPLRHESQAVRIIFAWLIDNTDLHVE